MHDDGDFVDLLIIVLAITLVVAGIEVADKGAFDDRAHSFVGRDGALGQNKGKIADTFAFQGTYGRAGEFT